MMQSGIDAFIQNQILERLLIVRMGDLFARMENFCANVLDIEFHFLAKKVNCFEPSN